MVAFCFFFSSRRRHTRSDRDWSSDVCSSDLVTVPGGKAPQDGGGVYYVDVLVRKASWLERLFPRSEEHTSELQSRSDLVCRLLLEKKKNSQSMRRFDQRHSTKTRTTFTARTS